MDSVNYYGSLCTEMYELLHSQAPQDELAFYLSYAHPGDRVLELLCGSGRFLVPFVQRGFDITGVDLSQEMLEKLLQKYPAAKVHRCSADAFESEERFDYIFISSGSVSLFTDPALCQRVLQKVHDLLAPGGVFRADIVSDQYQHKSLTSTKTAGNLRDHRAGNAPAAGFAHKGRVPTASFHPETGG